MTTQSTTSSGVKGKIKQIIGPVVDVHFEKDLPEIKTALLVYDGERSVTLEVSQHIGLDRVRCIAIHDTRGLTRGMDVENTKSPISVPVGEEVLGRLINVVGEAIDGKGAISKSVPTRSIHQDAPPFTEQQTKAEVFETGIKAVDLMTPFIKGGKVGLFLL